MPNIKQQKRRVSIAARQRLENLRYRSTAKTLYKRLETAVADGDKEAAPSPTATWFAASTAPPPIARSIRTGPRARSPRRLSSSPTPPSRISVEIGTSL